LVSHHEERSRRLVARWIDRTCRMAWAVILLTALLTGGAAYFTAARLTFDPGFDRLLSSDLPFRQTEAALAEAFPQRHGLLTIVVQAENAEAADDAAAALAARLAAMPERFRSVYYPEGLPFYRRNGLLYLDVPALEEMSDLLIKAQPLLTALGADPTLRGLTEILSLAIEQSDDKAATAVGPALNKMAAAVRNLEEGRDARLSWRTLLDPAGFRETEAIRRYVMVQPISAGKPTDAAGPALAAIADAAHALQLDASRDILVRVTGNALMLQDELQTVRKGMRIIGTLSVCLVGLLLIIGLQSLRLVFATAATVAVALAWTAAFAAAAFGAVNLASIAFAVPLVALSADLGILFAMRYREALILGDPRDALRQAGISVGPMLLLSAGAAAIVFLSFLATDYRGASELGAIAGAGMLIALFLSLTFLPALFRVMPMRLARLARWAAAATRTNWYPTLMRRHALGIVVFAAALGAAAAAIAPYAWFDDDPLNMRDPASDSVQAFLDLLGDPRIEPYSAELLAPDLSAADGIARRFASLPQVRYVETATSLIPADQDRKRTVAEGMALALTPLLSASPPPAALNEAERNAAFERLRALLANAKGGIVASARNLSTVLDRMPRSPEALAALERALLGGFTHFRERLVTMLAPEQVGMAALPAAMRDRWIDARGRALVLIHPRKDLRDPAARRDFVEAVRGVAQDVSGPPVRFTAVGETVVGAYRQAVATAAVLIAALLFLVLRRVRDVLFVLAPATLAALTTMALTVLLKTPFNLANVVVLPLMLALGVAFAVHVVLRHRGEASGTVMETSTPRAVVFSALITFAAFGTLALSKHPGTAGLGVLLMLSVGLAALYALLLLPALLELAGCNAHRQPDARRRPPPT
jgi:hopanoid biosynthesis associated RND transporter like protein HpnN